MQGGCERGDVHVAVVGALGEGVKLFDLFPLIGLALGERSGGHFPSTLVCNSHPSFRIGKKLRQRNALCSSNFPQRV